MIQVNELKKMYHDTIVLKGITFKIERNGIYGLLGPNGAGKSTLLKILSGSQFPSSGSVSVNGFNVAEQSLAVKKKIGYLPENAPLDLKLRVREYLFYIASLKGLKAEKRSLEIERVIDLCRLTDEYNTGIGFLSKGYRQRVGLAQALLNSPDILLLDEPLSGMDFEQIVAMRELFKAIGQSHIIILSTHILQEIASLCTKTYILIDGELVKSISSLSSQPLEEAYLTEVQHRRE